VTELLLIIGKLAALLVHTQHTRTRMHTRTHTHAPPPIPTHTGNACKSATQQHQPTKWATAINYKQAGKDFFWGIACTGIDRTHLRLAPGLKSGHLG
jgi:hypothetical protein